MRLITEMDRLASSGRTQPMIMESTLVTHYPGDVRAVEDMNTGIITYERKNTIRSKDTTLYRYVTSAEVPILSTDIIDQPISHTYRIRYIYNIWDTGVGTGNLHITVRTHIAEARISQDISIEFETPSEYPESSVSTIATLIMTMHNGWTVSNLATTIQDMSTSLKDMGLQHMGQLQRPYDISWKDLTYDHLIADPHAISFKADGTRMLLCNNKEGIFFVTSSLDIVPLDIHMMRDTGEFLVDGELIGSTYWIFDLLYADGFNRTTLSLSERRSLITTISSVPVRTPERTINIRIKPISIPDSADSFFKIITSTIDYVKENRIPYDGLIISPINRAYSHSVYKWKEPFLLTIDFFIGRGNLLHTFGDGKLVPHPELVPIMERGTNLIGTIGEFTYEGNNSWRWKRQRKDKATPNSEKVYNAIMNLHRDPITIDVLTGDSLKLMRKYHNRVKRSIYGYLANQGVGTITDVGSGKGGDLSSWIEHAFHVQAIEPKGTHIQGFLERVSSMDVSIDRSHVEDVPIIEVTGVCWDVILAQTDSDTYIDRVATHLDTTDALTLFNSATFLGPTSICSLIGETLREDGYIVIMVIDGKVLMEKFPSSTPHVSIRRIPCRESDDSFGTLGCINIELLGSSTVSDGGQDEKLVDVEILLDTMLRLGWIPETDMYLTDELLMGKEEAMYSSAQRLLIFRQKLSPTEIIRTIYTPLIPSTTESIDSPWGTVIRVGTLGDKETSFVHSLLQATNGRYRSLDNIGKSMYMMSVQGSIPTNIPIYMIPYDSWNIYYHAGNEMIMYSPLNIQGERRIPGIVLFYNKGHWEPLARPQIGSNLTYIW